MQLAIRVADGSTFGEDAGTCFTGLMSTLPQREGTCHTTRVLTLAQEQTINVKAFGYADDTGSADSGKVDVATYVSVIKVGNAPPAS